MPIEAIFMSGVIGGLCCLAALVVFLFIHAGRLGPALLVFAGVFIMCGSGAYLLSHQRTDSACPTPVVVNVFNDGAFWLLVVAFVGFAVFLQRRKRAPDGFGDWNCRQPRLTRIEEPKRLPPKGKRHV